MLTVSTEISGHKQTSDYAVCLKIVPLTHSMNIYHAERKPTPEIEHWSCNREIWHFDSHCCIFVFAVLIMNDELLQRLADRRDSVRPLVVPRTADTSAPLNYHSLSDEVEAWLTAKGFSQQWVCTVGSSDCFQKPDSEQGQFVEPSSSFIAKSRSTRNITSNMSNTSFVHEWSCFITDDIITHITLKCFHLMNGFNIILNENDPWASLTLLYQ